MGGVDSKAIQMRGVNSKAIGMGRVDSEAIQMRGVDSKATDKGSINVDSKGHRERKS